MKHIRKKHPLKFLTAKIIINVATALFLALAVFKAPELHAAWIRDKVGSKVVMITEKTGTSGGTGFLLEMPSGEVLTMTNAHVCNIQLETKSPLFAHMTNGRKVRVTIVEKYKKADLCLLKGIKGSGGLQVADNIDVGDELGVVGFPALQPLTLTRGQLVGYRQIGIFVHEGVCREKATMYKTITDPFYGQVCIESFLAGLTTVQILGGSSGSPVVNFFGNVVGVMFASGGPDKNNWGIIVKLEHLKDFIRNR